MLRCATYVWSKTVSGVNHEREEMGLFIVWVRMCNIFEDEVMKEWGGKVMRNGAALTTVGG